MKQLFLCFNFCLGLLPVVSQIQFQDASVFLANKAVFSGAPIGVVDMNGDGLDDIVRLDKTRQLVIDYQLDTSDFFAGQTFMNISFSLWSICVADINHDGYNDIFTGGASGDLNILFAKEHGSAYLTQRKIHAIFPQGSNFVDIDNDGHSDLFICNDTGVSVAFKNDGSGAFSEDSSLIYPISTVPSNNSGNYAAIWTDFDNDNDLDLYISKCAVGVQNPNDGRRLNLLFRKDGPGQWTELADSLGLQPKGQSWSTDFADIDNDGDLDCFIINHDIRSSLLLNKGDGHFVNINDSSGIVAFTGSIEMGIQGKFADFDNDGFVDLLLTNDSPSGHHLLLRNNGNLTFSDFSDSIPAPKRLQSAAIGDLNNDGFLDILGAYAKGFNFPDTVPDNLFLNRGNKHHYLKILLKGLVSNPNGIGARLECYGPWGKQIREVRSGEGYGVMHSFTQHFGLGTAEYIDSLIIKWPSGWRDKIYVPNIDQTLFVTEGETCQTSLDFIAVASGFTYQFLANPDSLARQWMWTFGDGNSSEEAQPIHTYDSTGYFEVCLEILSICGSTQSICKTIEITATSTSSPQEGKTPYLLFPNPGSEQINLRWEEKADEPVSIRLYNIAGQEISFDSKSQTLQSAQLVLPSLPSGRYQFAILTERGKWYFLAFVKN
ncbi:MAG: FG-GAP-like repeat-containing protein [Saprospiraceae bacterium]